ncbi:MAG: hypothetical protein SFX18_11615 [Pirellulales bacterium]|nr:hypothetical protein [Pirellulales bacterium]
MRSPPRPMIGPLLSMTPRLPLAGLWWCLAACLVCNGCGEEPITREVVMVPAPARAKAIQQELNQKRRAQDQQFIQGVQSFLGEPGKEAPSAAASAAPLRMLAALVPVPEKPRYYSFKLLGPPEIVAQATETFQDFLKSVDPGQISNNLPAWKLPAGWNVEPYEDGFGGVAKIRWQIGSQPLEIAVSELSYTGDWNEATLQNINRWRSQFQQPPLTSAELPQNSIIIKSPSATVTLFDQAGKFTGRRPAGLNPPSNPAPVSNP